MQLPKYWQFKSKTPYGFSNENTSKQIYQINIFQSHRAVLLNKEHAIIGTIEKRYARLLLNEANENNWISSKWENYKHHISTKEFPLLPKTTLVTFWIETNKTNQKVDITF